MLKQITVERAEQLYGLVWLMLDLKLVSEQTRFEVSRLIWKKVI